MSLVTLLILVNPVRYTCSISVGNQGSKSYKLAKSNIAGGRAGAA